MPLNRVSCPECGAGLKSPRGFTQGQTVCCSKCEAYFTVRDELAAGPARSDPDRSYRNSPLRYAILGVLVCVMVGLGVMLYLKNRDEVQSREAADDNNTAAVPPVNMLPLPGDPTPAGFGGPAPKGKSSTNGKSDPKGKAGGAKGGNPGGLTLPFLDSGLKLSPEQQIDKLREYRGKLIGEWVGSGKTAELVYREDGTFTDATGDPSKPVTGRWTADRLISGNKGVLITRTVGGEQVSVRAEFEGDELLHDTRERGVVGVFRKK